MSKQQIRIRQTDFFFSAEKIQLPLVSVEQQASVSY